MEGRVEICVNNQWGTVCDRNWEAAEASVACRQAGFSDQGWFSVFLHVCSLLIHNAWIILIIILSPTPLSMFF